MSDITKIQTALIEWGYRAKELGWRVGDCYLQIEEEQFYLMVQTITPAGSEAPVYRFNEFFPTVDEALSAIEKNNPDSIDDLAKQKLCKTLGSVIEQANALNLSVDFLNPLQETMKKLSENILEDHS